MKTIAIESGQTKWLNIGLWTAQILLVLVYGLAGFMKVSQPIPDLAAMMVWPGMVPAPFVRLLGVAELAGAAGLVLPMLTGILPRLTVAAALALALLQICAAIFHVTNAELYVLPVNSVLFALAVFIAWGRGRKLPL